MSRAHAHLARAAITAAPSSACSAVAGTALRARSPRQRVEYHPRYLTRCSKRSGMCRQSISSHCAPGSNSSALQALVQVRAVHDHSRFREVRHFLQRERRAACTARISRAVHAAFPRPSRRSRTWLAASGHDANNSATPGRPEQIDFFCKMTSRLSNGHGAIRMIGLGETVTTEPIRVQG